MAGDYEFYKRQYTRKEASGAVASGATANVYTAAKSASHRIFVQKVTISITTHANAKSITIRDTNSSPVVLGVVADQTAAAGVEDVLVFDFGPRGFALTLGKGLDIISEASGPAFSYEVEAYEKLDATIAYDAGASLQ